MRLINTIDQRDLAGAGRAAAAAEAAGYSGVMTLENRHDPFLPLAVAATTTYDIELATGVAIAFLRSPLSVAHLAWDLNAASGGRFVLGLGTQICAHNEKRFSVPWGPPVPRLREYVAALRAIWRCWHAGEPLAYAGEHYRFSLMPPNFVPEPVSLAPPPITLAAVGPAMIGLAGAVADGVRLHPLCTRRYVEDVVLPRISTGLAARGLARAQFEINGGGFIATGATPDEVAARLAWVRQRIGFYGSTPAYWPVLELEGFSDLGPHLNALTKARAWDRLAAAVPDALLEACTVHGTHADIAARVAARWSGLVDTLPLSASYEQPADLPAAVLAELRAIATPFAGFAR